MEATAGTNAMLPFVRSARTMLKVMGPTFPRGVSPEQLYWVQVASGEMEVWFSNAQVHVDTAWVVGEEATASDSNRQKERSKSEEGSPIEKRVV